MTDDKVRRVSSPSGVEPDGSVWTAPTMWMDDPGGTHALVPWETWELMQHALGEEERKNRMPFSRNWKRIEP